MSQPVNLNRFRKQKARAEKKVRANQNSALHGRSKAERELERARLEKEERDLDGLKRDT